MTNYTTRSMRTRWSHIMALMLVIAGLAWHVHAEDRIVLRGSVRLDANRHQVRLSDVADLDGDMAVALGDQIVYEGDSSSTQAVTVDLDSIRKNLGDAGANLGLLSLSGRECVVRWRSDDAGAAPSPQPAQAAPVEPATFASQFTGEQTIRGVVSDYLSRVLLHHRPEDVKLDFRASDKADLMASAVGFEFEIKPLASKLSSTMPLLINVFRGPVVERTIRLTVEVGVRQRVIVMQRYVAAGETLKPGDAIEDVRITAPHLVELPRRLSELLGQEAHGRLVPGQILEDDDIVSKGTIERNAEVWVRARHGMFVIRMRGRALEDGRIGDVIRVQRMSDRVVLTGIVGADGEIAIDAGPARPTEVSR